MGDPMGMGVYEILTAGVGTGGEVDPRTPAVHVVAQDATGSTISSLLSDPLDSRAVKVALTSMAKDQITYDLMKCDQSVAEFFKRMDRPYSSSPTGGPGNINGKKMDFLEYQDYLRIQGKTYLRPLAPTEEPQNGDIGWAKPGQNNGQPGHFVIWYKETDNATNDIFTTHSRSGDRVFSEGNFKSYEKTTQREYLFMRYVPSKK